MSRVRAALITTVLTAAFLLVAASAMAQTGSDNPSLGGRTTSDVMTTPTTTFSADATISTGSSNRFETPGFQRPTNQATTSWRNLPAEERQWLVRLVAFSMWRWLGL
jgi:hypothetical protein